MFKALWSENVGLPVLAAFYIIFFLLIVLNFNRGCTEKGASSYLQNYHSPKTAI